MATTLLISFDWEGMIRNYAGWYIYDNGKDSHPVTSRFQAYRYGVRIGHSTQEGLIKMIDIRESKADYDEQNK